MASVCNCKCTIYKRGTTPTLYYNLCVPKIGTEQYYITFRQLDRIIIEKTSQDIAWVDNDTFKLRLTQKETLMFSAKYPVETEIRVKYADGSATVSDRMQLTFKDIIKQGEI